MKTPAPRWQKSSGRQGVAERSGGVSSLRWRRNAPGASENAEGRKKGRQEPERRTDGNKGESGQGDGKPRQAKTMIPFSLEDAIGKKTADGVAMTTPSVSRKSRLPPSR